MTKALSFSSELLPISQNAYMPESWLRERIPKEILYYPSPYQSMPFWLKHEALDLATCALLLSLVKQQDSKEEVGVLVQDQGVVQSENNQGIRKADVYDVPSLLEEKFVSLIADYKIEMERFFNIVLHSPGPLQVLGYEPGSFYARYSDNCSEIIDEEGNIVLFQPVASHRMLTVILFLTTLGTHYDGGELRFDYLSDVRHHPLAIHPKAGMMVAFPSHPAYSHTVFPVTSGFRVSVVQWFNAMVM